MLGGAQACVVGLILGREAGRGLADSSPSLHDSGVAHRCTATSADFRVSPLSGAQMSVCRVDVSNLLLLQGCKETHESKEKLLGI